MPIDVLQHLAARHLHELHDGSGLSAETIAQRGYRTITDPLELFELGFAPYQSLTPGYLLPVFDTCGSNGRYYFKPDRPRADPDRPGRVCKYESQPDRGVVLDVPLASQPAIGDWRTPLLVTEGCKKADAAAQLGGYCVLDLIGVWCFGWRLWKDTGESLVDWRPILPSLRGRVVYICFDSDAADKDGVRRAEQSLAEFLEAHGARVFIIRLPNEPDGSKNGLDDFLVRHGAEAFEQLVREARSPRVSTRELQELKRQLSDQAVLLRNPNMRERDKLVALATINEAGWRTSTRSATPFVVNRGRIAEAVGLKPDAISQSLERLSGEDGLFIKEVTRTNGEHGEPRSVIKLTPRAPNASELRRRAAHLAPTYNGTRGGKRFCPDHPDAALITRTTLVCSECGQIVHQSAVRLKPHLEVSEDDPEKDDTPGNGPPSSPTTTGPRFAVSAPEPELLKPQDEVSAPPPVPPTGRCPRCGERWTPRKGSDATECGRCRFYAARELP